MRLGHYSCPQPFGFSDSSAELCVRPSAGETSHPRAVHCALGPALAWPRPRSEDLSRQWSSSTAWAVWHPAPVPGSGSGTVVPDSGTVGVGTRPGTACRSGVTGSSRILWVREQVAESARLPDLCSVNLFTGYQPYSSD